MSTTADLSLLRRKLAAADYSPDIYVRELASRCVGGHELEQQRKNIQTLSEDTHSHLKRNVFENYKQFIETAKEISFLESEMYQLSHMITEQRNILSKLGQTSILGDKVPSALELGENGSGHPDVVYEGDLPGDKSKRNDFEEGRRKLYDLLDKVEGCSHVTDVPNRFLLHEGDLVEMDLNENTALHRVHGYLLNDGFMIATWLPNRRGPIRFKFSDLYELDSLAVVNVRDLGGLKFAFKLLVYPDARLFQCANETAKKDWMESFEDAKKRRQKEQETQALKRSDTITQRERERLVRASIRRNPFLRNEVPENTANPFDEKEEDQEEGEDDENEDPENDAELPEWMLELNDDLEVLVAQREFEQAVDLIFKARVYCNQHSDLPMARVALAKLENRTKNLLEILENELTTEKSLQGGPRSARRAVKLLVKLGRSTQACELFLQHRSAVLKTTLSGITSNGAILPRVQRLTRSFFANVLESSEEFHKALGRIRSSSFIRWIELEVNNYADIIDSHLFKINVNGPLDVIATSFYYIREQAVQMQKKGVDLTFLIDARFRRNIERTICENRDRTNEAATKRSQEDKWEPINCFNQAGTETFIEEMVGAGFPTIKAYVYEECWISLTRNTTSFSLNYLAFAESLLKLFNPSLRSLINESLVSVFHSHLRHIEQAIRSDRLRDTSPKFIQRNAAFLLDTLLSLVEKKFMERTGMDCPKLAKLHASYSWMKESQSASHGNSGSTTVKYSDPNFV
ncbi:exocyst complex component 8-like [Tigriopus californicus]|uniref:exocyst complex component 8-like n=1 Tax=Tigriopus californicus TaxID=6832 RepID=UPI0027DA588B|nr:exocyst complex component 8-like [Tigriopus californicus]